MFKKIQDIIQKLCKYPVQSLSTIFFLVITISVIILILFFDKSPQLFLIDDGYYQIGKNFFEGKQSLFHSFRWPGLPLLFTTLNFFPDFLHPYLRLLLALVFMYGNIWVAKKIFQQYFSNKQFFWGGLISLCNPLILHWTLKSTPEIYLTFFIGIVYLIIRRLFKEYSHKLLAILIFIIIIGMAVKPVFFIIPFLIFIYVILIKRKDLIFPFFIVFFTIITSFVVLHQLTAPSEANNIPYGIYDLLGPTFLPSSMLETRTISFGSQQELMNNNPEESNLAIGTKKINTWITQYKVNHPNSSNTQMIIIFIKDNLWPFIFIKLLNPVLFITLASKTPETLSNLLINGLLIIFAFIKLRELYRIEKNSIIPFILVLLGYASVFFLTFSYARYSFPVMFYIGFLGGVKLISIVTKKVRK